jgi:hypothetical protein
MPYTRAWDETTPPGSARSDTIATELRNLERDIRERLDSLLGLGDMTADPLRATRLDLGGPGDTRIVGGTSGLQVRSNDDAVTNMYVANSGDVATGRDLSIARNVTSKINLLNDLEVQAGNDVTLRSPVSVIAAQTRQEFDDLSNVTGATDVDWDDGNNKEVVLVGNWTPTFLNPLSGAWYLLLIKQGGGGGFTISWPGTVTWPGGAAPIITATAGRTDLIAFLWTGTAYIGLVTAQDVNV